MTYKILGLLVGGLTLAATASPAFAANVSVEIEGQTVQTAPAAVATPAHVTKAGGVDCDGTTVIGALEAATSGDWAAGAYGAIDTIKGESHPFGPGGSWSFYLNGKFVNVGGCDAAVKDGDKVLFYWTNAYASAGYDEPVVLDAPATIVPGQATAITVREASTYFDPTTFEGTTTLYPSDGATVSGGTAPATTAPDGTTTVTVAPGPYTLVATKDNKAPARISGCATTGSDGFCGTTAGVAGSGGTGGGSATATGGAPTSAASVCTTSGDDGFCGSIDKRAALATISAVAEGKHYKKGDGPRELTGRVGADGSGLSDVRLRLTRNDKGRCATYDGSTEKFKTIKKCGAIHGTYFSVGAKQEFSYLLPAKLSRGRYVLDVQVVDQAGNTTKSLARGSSRVVFFVA